MNDEAMSPEMTVHRRYTVGEIDQMRVWVERACRQYGVSYRESERQAEVERKLRTYLLAGVEPEEVHQAALAAEERMLSVMRQHSEWYDTKVRDPVEIRKDIAELRSNLNRT